MLPSGSPAQPASRRGSATVIRHVVRGKIDHTESVSFPLAKCRAFLGRRINHHQLVRISVRLICTTATRTGWSAEFGCRRDFERNSRSCEVRIEVKQRVGLGRDKEV